MRKQSILGLALLAFAYSCGGDDSTTSGPGGAGGSGGSAGSSAGAGGSAGGSGGSTGGAGGSTGGAGGSTAGSGGSGGSTGGTGGAGGSSGTGGSGGKAGAGGSSGAAGSSGKAGASGSGGAATDAGPSDSGQDVGMTDVTISDASGGSCPAVKLPAAADFSKVGPFMAAPSEAGGPNCTVFRPTVLGEGGLKHPVVIWGNGTGGNPGVYTWLLAHWATHGFIVVAANTASAGTGAEMVGCLDWIESQNTADASIYQGKVLTGRAAASGHSQGGGGTLMAGRDPRFVTTIPFMAYTQQGFGGFDNASIPLQKGPMLLMSGSADTIAVPAQNQAPVFMNTNVPIFWATLQGADHVTFALGLTLGGGGAAVVGYLGPSTAWLRLQLMCDDTARSIFYGTPSCTLCQDAQWTVQRKGIN